MLAPALSALSLSPAEFREVARLAFEVAGLQLRDGKENLVRSRLARRLRALGLPTFGAYLAHVREDASRRELAEMVDLLTTNKTDFFREPAHFAYLRDTVLAQHPVGSPLRVWSAGCSTGEEPYTLAMVVREALPDLDRRDVRILATDISRRVLTQARAGVYAPAAMAGVPEALRRRHFARVVSPREASGRDAGAPAWQVVEPVRRLVAFAALNLMGPWPMSGPFDAIFCRNVMIYFDKPTQQGLVDRFRELLAPGGHLFVGHAESLSGLSHRFRFVQPAVYRR